MVDREKPEAAARWLALIGQAKTTLPCSVADSRHIWERFREFNRRRGREAGPAGYLLGFMRKWRAPGVRHAPVGVERDAPSIKLLQRELQRLIAQAPFANRHFHENDLKRVIGKELYNLRLAELRTVFGCSEFQAKLALHGRAVRDGTIPR